MATIGIIREGKIPADNRVALTPAQCKWLLKSFPSLRILVQPSANRCFADREYERAGAELSEDLSLADYLFGIKEVPIQSLLENKTYLFFSHTKKLQPYNQLLFRSLIEKRTTLIDYECLEHDDGQRIIGFGFFAGVVGAHNGLLAYGKRTGLFNLERVYKQKNFKELIHNYFEIKLPPIKIAVTGSGRVAHGIMEVLNLIGVREVEPDEYCSKVFSYPVYTQLKGGDLFRNRITGSYAREEFHTKHQDYACLFGDYLSCTDILLNGIYWEEGMDRLFEAADIRRPDFKIVTIADITDDAYGSIPINLGDQTIEDPVYGVDKSSLQKTAPYQSNAVDIIAVGNLPNELPRDASRYFGEQLIKFILEDLLIKGGSPTLERATILREGKLTEAFQYMRDYATI
ncbi:MAG: NAD(P)-dependent oxidoreductase [Bacteroidota bacterium]|nr:alanine dehydrogenase [Bacteroidota bacterium]